MSFLRSEVLVRTIAVARLLLLLFGSFWSWRDLWQCALEARISSPVARVMAFVGLD